MEWNHRNSFAIESEYKDKFHFCQTFNCMNTVPSSNGEVGRITQVKVGIQEENRDLDFLLSKPINLNLSPFWPLLEQGGGQHKELKVALHWGRLCRLLFWGMP